MRFIYGWRAWSVFGSILRNGGACVCCVVLSTSASVCYVVLSTIVLHSSAQHNTADTGTTGPQYATKHRPRTSTIDEPHGVISIKYRIIVPEDGS
jgi:hypothetical protein